MYRAAILIIPLIVFMDLSFAKGSCENLVEELKIMKSAQNKVMISLARRSESAARLLEDGTKKNKRINYQKAIDIIRGSIKKDEEIVKRFDKASEELFQRTYACLTLQGE